MTDLQIAKKNLEGNTICLVKKDSILTKKEKGILPTMQLLEQKVDLTGYSVADLIVGKAVAFLFVKAKIKAVYAKVISRQGLKILNQYHIDCEYDNLAEQIINREKTDICPMEKATQNATNPEEAYLLIKQALAKLKT